MLTREQGNNSTFQNITELEALKLMKVECSGIRRSLYDIIKVVSEAIPNFNLLSLYTVTDDSIKKPRFVMSKEGYEEPISRCNVIAPDTNRQKSIFVSIPVRTIKVCSLVFMESEEEKEEKKK